MRFTRRAFGGGIAAGAGVIALGGRLRPAAAAVDAFRMIEAGGASGESIQKGYIEPFTKRTGIQVTRESPSGLGKLRAMVESGNVTAPLLELASQELEQAKALDLVEPVDWEAVDPLPMFDEARQEMGLGYQYYSTIMAWREEVKAPQTWADIWDVENFPGKRTLPDRAGDILPMAALADGVPLDELYPLDLDRAFAALERIKGAVAVWWQAGAQAPQLLKDNEVQYAVAWSGRVAGQPGIAWTYSEGQLDLAYFVVPKGTPADLKEAAMGLLHEMTVPENQAVAAEVVPYTGNSPDLEALLPQDKLDQFPTTSVNKDKQFLANAKWWFENADEIETRWQEFKLGL